MPSDVFGNGDQQITQSLQVKYRNAGLLFDSNWLLFRPCFLLHVLPGGFHRIRHFGLIANNGGKEKLALARELLDVTSMPVESGLEQEASDPLPPTYVCKHCGAAMLIIETMVRSSAIRAPPALCSSG